MNDVINDKFNVKYSELSVKVYNVNIKCIFKGVYGDNVVFNINKLRDVDMIIKYVDEYIFDNFKCFFLFMLKIIF